MSAARSRQPPRAEIAALQLFPSGSLKKRKPTLSSACGCGPGSRRGPGPHPGVEPAAEQFRVGGLDVGHDELQPLERARRHGGTTPSPITIEQPEPGGVSCTIRMDGPTVVSWSTRKPSVRRRTPSPDPCRRRARPRLPASSSRVCSLSRLLGSMPYGRRLRDGFIGPGPSPAGAHAGVPRSGAGVPMMPVRVAILSPRGLAGRTSNGGWVGERIRRERRTMGTLTTTIGVNVQVSATLT